MKILAYYIICYIIAVAVILGILTENSIWGFIIFRPWVSKLLGRKHGEIAAFPSIMLYIRAKQIEKEEFFKRENKNKKDLRKIARIRAFDENLLKLFNIMVVDKCYCVTTHDNIISKIEQYEKDKKIKIISKVFYKKKKSIEIKLLDIKEKAKEVDFYKLIIIKTR